MKLEPAIVFAVVFALTIAQGDSLPHRSLCRDAISPASMPHGVNHVSRSSDVPLFELKVSQVKSSGRSFVFEVRISVRSEEHAFSKVTVSLSSKGSCGTGDLQFSSDDFHEVQQDGSCPKVLITTGKTVMTKLAPLYWTPPPCGCVQFRTVIILDDGKYYFADNEAVTSGSLAKLVCVPGTNNENITREQSLEALCDVVGKHSSAEIMSRVSFKQRHDMETRYMDKHELEMALELRRSDAMMCCSKENEAAKARCFEDAHFRRVDRFCHDGYPDIPFTSFRLQHMREKEKKCCYILGSYRYSCFANDAQKLVPGPHTTSMDFSMDATDPVNDLAVFGSLQDFNDFLDKHNLQDERKSASKDIVGRKESYFGDGVVRTDADNMENSQIGQAFAHLPTSEKNHRPTNPSPVFAPQPSVSGRSQQQFFVLVPITSSFQSTATPPRFSSKEFNRLTPVRRSRRKNSEATRSQPKIEGGRSRLAKRRKSAMGSGERRRNHRRRTWRRYDKTRRSRHSGEKAIRRRTSAERLTDDLSFDKDLTGFVGRKGQTHVTSAERRAQGRASRQRDNHGGNSQPFMEDLGDQGQSSVEQTLIKLQQKMTRLRLRTLCCQSGAASGRNVYGSLSVVLEECYHSSEKYIKHAGLTFGVKRCKQLFAKCCRDESITGLTLSSSEFHDKTYGLANNPQLSDDVMSVYPDRKLSRFRGKGKRVDDREKWERFDAKSDRRFNSMRAKPGDPRYRPSVDISGMGDDDDYTGPKLFDDIDNEDNARDVEDYITKQDNSDMTNSTDRRTVVVLNNSSISDKNDTNSDLSGSTSDSSDSVNDTKDEEDIGENFKQKKSVLSMTRSTIGRSKSDEQKTPVQSNKDGLAHAITKGHHAATVTKLHAKSGGRNGRRSKEAEKHVGGLSSRRNRFGNRRRYQKYQRFQSQLRRFYPAAGMDSREMAVANNGHLKDTIDSREMAAKYRRLYNYRNGKAIPAPARSRGSSQKRRRRRKQH